MSAIIRFVIVVVFLSAASCGGGDTPQKAWPGDTVWTMPLSASPLPAGTPAGVTSMSNCPGGKDYCIQISADATNNNVRATAIPVDLTPFRGMNVKVECAIKADGVTPTVITGNGVKCMLSYTSATLGTKNINVGTPYGTFDWTNFASNRTTIAPDATNGVFYIGFQDTKGTAWVTDIHLTMWRPAIDPNAPPMVRGHVPLRGVMSPASRWGNAINTTPINTSTIDSDFVDLQSWKANLIRFQFGGLNDDQLLAMDAAAYDAWVDAHLPVLDAALADAQKRGVKVVIALFSIPGGREADFNYRIFFDKGYQATFLATWQKLATRYRGNPAVFAYDLWNEPTRRKPLLAGWPDAQGLQEQAAALIRAIDPDTPICFETDDDINSIIPVKTTHAIYEFHVYAPSVFTHQGVGGRAYGGVSYGDVVEGAPLNKAWLRAYLQPIRNFQLAFRVPVYIGEFSAVRWAPGAAGWLTDNSSLFDEYGWDWTYHAFREYDGWDLEMVNLPYGGTPTLSATPTDRMTAIRYWLDQNTSPY